MFLAAPTITEKRIPWGSKPRYITESFPVGDKKIFSEVENSILLLHMVFLSFQKNLSNGMFLNT
jgi:hypothetical protein